MAPMMNQSPNNGELAQRVVVIAFAQPIVVMHPVNLFVDDV